ncbi:MAG: hypothetical protein NTV80_11700 [Verrucomicrobia bacterium]|nr:hypothetical protein [Verrucomicrobiota bacterium]
MNRLLLQLGLMATLFCTYGCSSTSTSTESGNEPVVEEASFDTKVSRLKIGMSKQQVFAIMGDDYTQMGRMQSAQGSFEGLHYTPNYGSRLATTFKRQYTLGIAGRNDTTGVTLQLQNGRLSSINQH